MSIFKKIALLFALALLPFTFARAGLLWKYPEIFSSLSAKQVLWAFVYGLRFDLSSLTIFAGLPLLMMSIPFPFFQSRKVTVFLGTVMFLSLMVISWHLGSDVIYFAEVKRHISNEPLYLNINDLPFFTSYIWHNLKMPLLAFCFLASTCYWLWLKVLRVPTLQSPWHPLKTLLLWAFFFVAGRGGVGLKPIAIVDAFMSGNNAESQLILNGAFSSFHSMLTFEKQNHEFFSKEDLGKILSLKHGTLDQPFPLERVSEIAPKGFNLVVLIMESLTTKYVDSFGHRNFGVTPFLDSLAEKSLKFTNFYSYGQRSVEGLQSVLTGVPVLTGMPSVGTGLTANYTKLGTMAEQNGYSHLFVSSMLRHSFRFDAVAGSAGFSNYYGMEDMPILLDYEEQHPLGWDYETFMFSLQKINELKKPFISFIFPSTDHTPYMKLPKQFMKYPHSADGEGGFLNAVFYTDWALGEFFKKAEKEAWFDKTIFVITGDHVLAHFQDGGFLEKFNIPLLIYAPKIFPPQVVSTLGSHLDLVPTFIETLGLKGRYSVIGENLFTKKDPKAYVKEGNVLGIITDKGYLRHTLKNRLDAKTFNSSETPQYLDNLEKKLLAFDQLTFHLIFSNRWAR